MEHGGEPGLPPERMTNRLPMIEEAPAIYPGPAGFTSSCVQGVHPWEGGIGWQAYACSIRATAAGGWTIRRRNILVIAIGPDVGKVGWHPRWGVMVVKGARVASKLPLDRDADRGDGRGDGSGVGQPGRGDGAKRWVAERWTRDQRPTCSLPACAGDVERFGTRRNLWHRSERKRC